MSVRKRFVLKIFKEVLNSIATTNGKYLSSVKLRQITISLLHVAKTEVNNLLSCLRITCVRVIGSNLYWTVQNLNDAQSDVRRIGVLRNFLKLYSVIYECQFLQLEKLIVPGSESATFR